MNIFPVFSNGRRVFFSIGQILNEIEGFFVRFPIVLAETLINAW